MSSKEEDMGRQASIIKVLDKYELRIILESAGAGTKKRTRLRISVGARACAVWSSLQRRVSSSHMEDVIVAGSSPDMHTRIEAQVDIVETLLVDQIATW